MKPVHRETKPAIAPETQLTYEQSVKVAEMMDADAEDGATYLEWMRAEAERSRSNHGTQDV
jgi:hypothetical protein